MSTAADTDAEVTAYLAERGVTEILHFTTNPGLIGILATGAVLSRDRLSAEKYIEFVYTPNCADRLKDADWTDYVNLSISRVNNHMLGSSMNWHAVDGLWWTVLAFDPSIAADPDVVFTTTNNTYPTVRRAAGVTGLAAMYAEHVPWGYYDSVKHRWRGMPTQYTTDPQAEVLYPGRVGLDRLTSVYVHDEEHIDEVKALLATLRTAPMVPVHHRPEVFQ